MAAVAPLSEQAADLLKNLSLDPKKKTREATEVSKKTSANAGDANNTQIPSTDRSVTPLLQEFMDQNMWYPSMPYYYGAYDGSVNEWEDYARYLSHDGVEMPHGVYGDMYHHGYGYAPYGAYPSGSPVPAMGHDGQLYGTHQYQYPSMYYQPPTPTAATNPSKPQSEVSTSKGTEQQPTSVDSANTNSNGVANGNLNKSGGMAAKPSHQNSTVTSNGSHKLNTLSSGLPSPVLHDVRLGFDGFQSPVPWIDAPTFSDGVYKPATNKTASSTVSHNTSTRSQNLHNVPQLMGLNGQKTTSAMRPLAPGYLNRMYPNSRIYGQYGNTLRGGFGFGFNGFDSRMNGHWGVGMDGKYKAKGRANGFYGYGNENFDGLTELNRGPRSGRFRNQKGFAPTVTNAVKGQDLETSAKSEASVVSDKDQYNRIDFPEKYTDAKFFVIKSYSEDDVHKSIKYGVWASTPNGNKKLDASYQEAQEKAGGCPVFLFFSVNTSGQFVGVAEMLGPVDFNNTVDYWQQDKWNGCFPVKWHIVKDVPNSILKHITLENNDNKPVTNSRDTQEVKLEQGVQMLKIFKNHASKTSILDDFGFYEVRQKALHEKKAKQQLFQKQMSNGKLSDSVSEKDDSTLKHRLHKPLEVVTVLKKEATEENGVAPVGDAIKIVKPVAEKRALANGVTNDC